MLLRAGGCAPGGMLLRGTLVPGGMLLRAGAWAPGGMLDRGVVAPGGMLLRGVAGRVFGCDGLP
jgi:hypothetical protein